MLEMLIGLGLTFLLALVLGKLVSKLRLPAILGWLISGMIAGPHLLNLVSDPLLTNPSYTLFIHLLECTLGLMIGSELILSKLKKSGKKIFFITLGESLGTFIVVTTAFFVVLKLTNGPLYLSPVFGGIALATAPAPSLSIVKDMKTKGEVTDTLIPLAALDDLFAAVIFFLVIGIVGASVTGSSIPVSTYLFLVFLPIPVGALIGFIFGKLANKRDEKGALIITIAGILTSLLTGLLINHLSNSTLVNFMLLGMAYSTVLANLVGDKLKFIMQKLNPVILFSLILVIINLGAPLDYHLILNAGLFTFIYILARGIGKYLGAFISAKLVKASDTVVKYLGLTILPHSGVSLVFTGVACASLASQVEAVNILQGTIAAAAVINEIIAVILAKKGFEYAKEIGENKDESAVEEREFKKGDIRKEY